MRDHFLSARDHRDKWIAHVEALLPMNPESDLKGKRFQKIINTRIAKSLDISLVHSTDAYRLRDMVDDGEVIPQTCDVFPDEKLTYLFYGRPAYRVNANEKPAGLQHFLPICLIFKPEWTPLIKRVFPFDSGAFENGMYEAFLHKGMKLDDFELEPDLRSAGKLISLFFQSPGAYMSARAKPSLDLDPEEFEAHSYMALLNAKGSNSVDCRSSSIEIQVSDPIDLHSSLEAVILPSSFSNGNIGSKIRALGVLTLPYNTYDHSKPIEYMSSIMDICLRYYVEQGRVELE